MDEETIEEIYENDYLKKLNEIINKHYRFGKILKINEIMSFYKDYEEPILDIKGEGKIIIEFLYNKILDFIGIKNNKKNNLSHDLESIMITLKDVKLIIKDEIYLTILKLTRNNPNKDSLKNLWQLFSIIVSSIKCSYNIFLIVSNYLFKILKSNILEEYKIIINFSLKRLYFYNVRDLYRVLPCSLHELEFIKSNNSIPIQVYFFNNYSLTFYIESYSTYKTLIKEILTKFNLSLNYTEYFELLEVIDKNNVFEERYCSKDIYICDTLSYWDLLKKEYPEIKARFYFKLLINPNLNPKLENLNEEIYYNFIYQDLIHDIKNNKIEIEANESLDIISNCFQADYNNFSESNKFEIEKLKNYISLYDISNFSLEEWEEKINKKYKKLKGKSRFECIKEIFNLLKKNNELYFESIYFPCKFNKSNIKNFSQTDLKECIIFIKSNKLILAQNNNLEIIEKIDFTNLLNWGINKNIFVLSYGEKSMINKIYFESNDTFIIHKILSYYTSFLINKEIEFNEEEALELIQHNLKNRNPFVYLKKQNIDLI